eukprot:scaffold273966_cov22-Tisochrysis_lutea.AAC.1
MPTTQWCTPILIHHGLPGISMHEGWSLRPFKRVLPTSLLEGSPYIPLRKRSLHPFKRVLPTSLLEGSPYIPLRGWSLHPFKWALPTSLFRGPEVKAQCMAGLCAICPGTRQGPTHRTTALQELMHSTPGPRQHRCFHPGTKHRLPCDKKRPPWNAQACEPLFLDSPAGKCTQDSSRKPIEMYLDVSGPL